MDSVDEQDPPCLQARLQQELADGVFEAIAQLRRAAQGRMYFTSDHEFHACVALARMARLMFADVPEPEASQDPASQFNPDYTLDEIDEENLRFLESDRYAVPSTRNAILMPKVSHE